MLPTLADFIVAQGKDAFCDQAKQQFGTWNLLFKFDRTGLLMRQAPLHGSIQKVVSLSLRSTILDLTLYAILVGPLASAECATPYVKITTGPIWPRMFTIQFDIALIVPEWEQNFVISANMNFFNQVVL